MFKTSLLSSVFVCFLVAPCAQASNWYWGAGGGGANIQNLCAPDNTYECDASGLVVRGLGGYQVNRAVSFEAALDIGVGFNSPYLYPSYPSHDDDSNLSYAMLQAQALFAIPLAKRVSLITAIGACLSFVSYDEDDEISSSIATKRQKNSGSQPVADWFDDDDDDHDHNDDDNNGADAEFCGSGLIGLEVGLSEKSSLRIQNQYYVDVQGDGGFRGKKDINAVTVNFIRKF